MSTIALAPAYAPAGDLCGGWVHTFGVYYPKRNVVEHRNSPWSQAVLQAKRKHERIIQRFAEIVAAHLRDMLRRECDYIVTPVPAEPRDDRHLFHAPERSVTELLADGIQVVLGGRLQIRTEDLLIQVRPKAMPQHHCTSIEGRAANVRGIYSVREGIAFTGSAIILVDDVITSGATMNECARVLRGRGADEVMGVALARTVHL